MEQKIELVLKNKAKIAKGDGPFWQKSKEGCKRQNKTGKKTIWHI